ncbi:hypothetical protein PFHG_05368 [Plasmodium falciparum HB3]|uniref:Uncharacterized protein n=1 Tax=Plasmodium falciparum (isolate HB3) TaxID=137071 RepID=A0A0L7KK28_PLAFX|nr:hypothetical protein PFHG_05368 [Plasmodium falciparum HB3]
MMMTIKKNILKGKTKTDKKIFKKKQLKKSYRGNKAI